MFPVQPVPSNSGWRPCRKVKHWTSKGDCKVTGNKERNPQQFYKENPFKNEQTQINENWQFAFNFIYEITLKKIVTKKAYQKIEIAFKFT